MGVVILNKGFIKHMRIHRFFLSALMICAFLMSTKCFAQTAKHKIAIFAPLYLDSAFDGDNEYRYPKNVFPKFINPGLEFCEGVQLALDTLSFEGSELEVFFFDTKSISQTLSQQLDQAATDSVELILSYCGSSDIKP